MSRDDARPGSGRALRMKTETWVQEADSKEDLESG